MSRRLQTQAELCREAVAELDAAVKRGRTADRTLHAFYRGRRHLGSRDRRLLSALVYSRFRWRGWTEDPALAFYLDATERHPVVDILLDTPERVRSVQPMGAASMEDKAAALSEWTKAGMPPKTAALFPDWLADELRLGAFQNRPPVWLRVREHEADRVFKRIEALELDHTVHPRIPLAVSSPDHRGVTALRQEVQGAVEMQTLCSQIVGLVCAVKPGHYWWDACCGAGGKSLHLNELMKYKGRILASDERAEVLNQFRKRVHKGNLAHIEMHVLDACIENLADQKFDGILADAPCSGIGTWARNPDARWRLRPKHVAMHAETQKAMLGNLKRSVREGGALVYAVCTLTEEETTGVVEAVLAEHPELQLAPFESPHDGSQTDGTLLLHPNDHQGDGMFVARFVKK